MNAPNTVPTGIAGDDTLPAALAATDSRTQHVVAGMRFGRYELRHPVGQGGMGVVWSAHDPELGRMVAIKLLRPSAATKDAELRLRREAQTMARLVHPNVIRVYDVGTAHDRVFVAMEYITGATIKEHLAAGTHDVDAILALFAQVGRGLAAAHDAGLVHRDVKPTNILVAEDGRVLVTDFGLARLVSEPTTDGPALAAGSHDSPETITRPGAIMGTPAYMAPEQFEGDAIDARADQFSFCVALWGALYERAPFEGTTFEALALAVTNGELVPPPASSRVPAHVRAALERGLSPDPAARFASMHALLAALGDDPRRRRKRLALAGGLLGVGLAIAGVTWQLSRPEAGAACAVDDDPLAGIWDDTVRGELASAARRVDSPFAGRAFDAIAGHLDRQRAAWEAMRRDNCEATRVRKQQSDAAMDLRAACLDRRREEIRSLVTQLRDPDAKLLDQASERASFVGDVTACADVTALARRSPLPADERVRAQVTEVEHAVAGARAAVEGDRRIDRTAIDALVSRARELGYAPATAAALYVAALDRKLAAEHAAAATLLDEALLQAETGGDDLLRVEISTSLADVVGSWLEKFDDGIRHAERALAVIQRLGADPRRESAVVNVLASVHWRKGEFPRARELAERALALAERAAPESLDVASRLLTLGIVLNDSDDPNGSMKVIDRGIAVVTAGFGPDHPRIARLLNTRGGNLRRLGKLDEAKADYERALEIYRASVGDDAIEVAFVFTNLGTLLDKAGDQEGAIASHRGAIQIFERKLGAKHSRTIVAYERLGGTLSKAGHDDEALATLRRVVELQRANLGDNHPFTSNAYFQLGKHYSRIGKPADALAQFEKAAQALIASQGPDSKLLARVYSATGDAQFELKRPREAAASFQAAIEHLGDDAKGGERYGQFEFNLAEAWLAAGERTNALAAARRAKARYVALGPSHAKDVAEVDAWLAKHRR